MRMICLCRIVLAAVAVLFFAACDLSKGKEAATKAADTFHQQFNAGKFSEIYRTATPAFQSSEPKFLEFIHALRGKLGALTSATQHGWRTNVTTQSTSVMLFYNSQFERGSAQETFTFVVSGETATLQGYNVSSQELLTGAPPATATVQFASADAAQREAVRRYPDLGKSGSTLNQEFVARHKRLQQEQPEALRDPSWPLRLAEEAAQAVGGR